jgi:hypothetical protein
MSWLVHFFTARFFAPFDQTHFPFSSVEVPQEFPPPRSSRWRLQSVCPLSEIAATKHGGVVDAVYVGGGIARRR